MSRKRIGELLLERGAITPEQLEQGLAAQAQSRQKLGTTLVHMGIISEIVLAQVLAESLELATVDLTQLGVDWSAVHLVRAAFCETHGLFPFAIDGKGTPAKKVMVAMSDPFDEAALDEIEFTTGIEVAPFVSTISHIRAAILRYYHKVPDPRFDGNSRPTPRPSAASEPGLMVTKVVASTPAAPAPAESPSRGAATPAAGTGGDLDFLLGRGGEDGATERLEHRFWALMRLLNKKGIVSREEFLAELDEKDG